MCSAFLLACTCFILEGIPGCKRMGNKVLLVISQESLAKKRTSLTFLLSASFKLLFFLFLLLLCVFRKGQAFVQALHKINIKYFLFPTVINVHCEQIYCSHPEMNSFLLLPKSSFLKSTPYSQISNLFAVVRCWSACSYLKCRCF